MPSNSQEDESSAKLNFNFFGFSFYLNKKNRILKYKCRLKTTSTPCLHRPDVRISVATFRGMASGHSSQNSDPRERTGSFICIIYYITLLQDGGEMEHWENNRGKVFSVWHKAPRSWTWRWIDRCVGIVQPMKKNLRCLGCWDLRDRGLKTLTKFTVFADIDLKCFGKNVNLTWLFERAWMSPPPPHSDEWPLEIR